MISLYILDASSKMAFLNDINILYIKTEVTTFFMCDFLKLDHLQKIYQMYIYVILTIKLIPTNYHKIFHISQLKDFPLPTLTAPNIYFLPMLHIRIFFSDLRKQDYNCFIITILLKLSIYSQIHTQICTISFY